MRGFFVPIVDEAVPVLALRLPAAVCLAFARLAKASKGAEQADEAGC